MNPRYPTEEEWAQICPAALQGWPPFPPLDCDFVIATAIALTEFYYAVRKIKSESLAAVVEDRKINGNGSLFYTFAVNICIGELNRRIEAVK